MLLSYELLRTVDGFVEVGMVGGGWVEVSATVVETIRIRRCYYYYSIIYLYIFVFGKPSARRVMII